ncbi:hypothetical protein ACWEWU_09460 [Staphylococcus xylosus]
MTQIQIVKKDFTDAEDNKHIYHKGERFPRQSVDVTKERVDALATTNNKRNEVLIYVIDNSMTKKDIVSIIKELNIKIDEKATKAEILEFLSNL